MTNVTDERMCARCGTPISTTSTAPGTVDQLTIDRVSCPSCGAELVRDVQGHEDRGWRLAEPES